MTIEASAPGKAVLCGEYAVLDGAPAIAMAVSRRARVRVTETGDAWHRVSAPGLHPLPAVFRSDAAGSLAWRDGRGDARRFALLEQVWRAAAPPWRAGLDLVIDTRPFFREPGGPKLGLGSSAALAAALAAALCDAAASTGDLYRTAAVAHRHFQDGRGSGVDVAAAVHGGVIGYRMEAGQAERLDWPGGLYFELLWSGRPASTAGKLARLAAAPRGASADGLGDAAAAAAACWQAGRAGAILESLRAYTAALRRFSDDHDLGVFDGGHRELAGEAHGYGVVYKPCGAGGGDIGIAFAGERAALAAFAESSRSRGFEPLAAACDARGARREGGLAS